MPHYDSNSLRADRLSGEQTGNPDDQVGDASDREVIDYAAVALREADIEAARGEHAGRESDSRDPAADPDEEARR